MATLPRSRKERNKLRHYRLYLCRDGRWKAEYWIPHSTGDSWSIELDNRWPSISAALRGIRCHSFAGVPVFVRRVDREGGAQ